MSQYYIFYGAKSVRRVVNFRGFYAATADFATGDIAASQHRSEFYANPAFCALAHSWE